MAKSILSGDMKIYFRNNLLNYQKLIYYVTAREQTIYYIHSALLINSSFLPLGTMHSGGSPSNWN